MHKIQEMLAIAMLTVAAGAGAAGPVPADAAKAQYDAERARCMSGTTGQDQAACLKSAGAAYDAIRQNRLSDANGNYRANALERCKNLPASDRADCEARIDGDGSTSGSVKHGGILRERTTTVPPTPPGPDQLPATK